MKITFLVVVMVTGWSVGVGRKVEPLCERIDVKSCSRIGYRYTMLPNSLGHRDQYQAKRAMMRRWSKVLRKRCSPLLDDFLCRVYLPHCGDDQSQIPCRSVCNTIRRDCRRVMKKMNIKWPSSLRCSKLPKKRCFGAVRATRSPKTVKPTKAKGNKEDNSQGSACQKITIPMCQGIGYNFTTFPNIFNHRTQEEATEILEFVPAVKVGCSTSLNLFLCSMYTPVCTKIGTLPPCRSLCETSKQDCEPLMNRFGFIWPAKFNCSRFPEESSGQTCISKPPDTDREITNETITNPPTKEIEAIVKTFNYSQTDTPQGRRCQNLKIPMCSELGYNLTTFPNMFYHRNQDEAVLELNKLYPLVVYQCSASLPLFLCSMYAPVCTAEVGALLPCRSLCKRALRGCKPVMNQYGFKWPAQFKCSRFPDERSGQVCIS